MHEKLALLGAVYLLGAGLWLFLQGGIVLRRRRGRWLYVLSELLIASAWPISLTVALAEWGVRAWKRRS